MLASKPLTLYQLNSLKVSGQFHYVPVLPVLDLSTTFDTIDPCILLEQLENQFFFFGLALTSLKSYLSEITLCFSYKNTI